MHQHWWINDPDCLLLRDKLHFSLDEIRGIATSKALSGGSFVLSDDLNAVSAERLRIALQLLPPAPIAATAIDLLERETPELFRMQLRSNFAHQALFHSSDLIETDVSYLNTPAIPFTVNNPNNLTNINNNNNTTLPTASRSAPVTPVKAPRLYGNDTAVTIQQELAYPYSPTGDNSSLSNHRNTTIPGAHIKTSNNDRDALTNSLHTQFYDTQDTSPPPSPTSHSSITTNTNTNTNYAHFSRVTMGSLSLSLSRCNSPQRPGPLSKDASSNHANNLLHNAVHNMSSVVPDSPRISRKHSFEKGLILRASSDLNLLRKQRRKVKEILREENAINEDDLLGEYTLFTACNWSEVPKKDHFVSLRQIFGVEYIAQLVARGVLFENLLRLQHAAAAQKAERARRDKNLPKPTGKNLSFFC